MLIWLNRIFHIAALTGVMTLQAATIDPTTDIQVSFKMGAVKVLVPKGAHIKKEALEVELTSTPGSVKVGTLPPATGKDELDDEVYHGTVAIPISGKGLTGVVELEIRYQVCTEGEEGTCYPPTSRSLKIPASEIPTAKP